MGQWEAVGQTRDIREGEWGDHWTPLSGSWTNLVLPVPKGKTRYIESAYWFNRDSATKTINLRVLFGDPFEAGITSMQFYRNTVGSGVGERVPERPNQELFDWFHPPLGVGDRLQAKMTTAVTTTAPEMYITYRDLS